MLRSISEFLSLCRIARDARIDRECAHSHRADSWDGAEGFQTKFKYMSFTVGRGAKRSDAHSAGNDHASQPGLMAQTPQVCGEGGGACGAFHF
jgi:hypothetical protein